MESHPSSPGSSPVDVGECLQHLLKFTLQSRINGTLKHDLGLSENFCSQLINDDLPLSSFDSADSLQEYSNFYKKLALALWKWVSRASCGTYVKMALLDELKDTENWNELIIKEGAELVKILKTVNFELHVQEPFFTQLKDGLKTVEGRCAAGDYIRIQPGALILFNKCLLFEVQDISQYPSFSAMLQAESLAKVLPGVKTIADGVQVYRNFYSEERELSSGVLAIHVRKSDSQPYIIVSKIISGLGYNGIQSLLGLSNTVEAISE